MTPVVLVHGGAGRIGPERLDSAGDGVEHAARTACDLLASGATALDAAVAAVRVLEEDACFNAGRGSCMTEQGTFEMDAAIMRGSDLRSGAIAAVPDLRNPIDVARAVMRDSAHCLLAGAGAEAFARRHGVGQFGRDLVWTEKAQRSYDQAKAGKIERYGQADTVGAVVMDAHGELCVGCSTGGVLLKAPGRVGDSPLCGAGFYAAAGLGASCATGVGEAILTHVAAYEVLRRIAAGTDPAIAAQEVCDKVATIPEATCGLILITGDGRAAAAHQSRNMSWAIARPGDAVRSGISIDQGGLLL